MVGHNIHCKGVTWKIIPKLSPLPLLTWSTVNTMDPDKSVLSNQVNAKLAVWSGSSLFAIIPSAPRSDFRTLESLVMASHYFSLNKCVTFQLI